MLVSLNYRYPAPAFELWRFQIWEEFNMNQTFGIHKNNLDLKWLAVTCSLHMGLPSGLFTSVFPPPKACICFSSPCTWHMPHPSQPTWFGYPNNMWWGIHIGKLPLCGFLQHPVTSSLGLILLSTLLLNSFSCVLSLLSGDNTVFHSVQQVS
jgi:hypothetical protein